MENNFIVILMVFSEGLQLLAAYFTSSRPGEPSSSQLPSLTFRLHLQVVTNGRVTYLLFFFFFCALKQLGISIAPSPPWPHPSARRCQALAVIHHGHNATELVS